MSIVIEPHTELNRVMLGQQYAAMFGVVSLIGSVFVSSQITTLAIYQQNKQSLPNPLWLVPAALVYAIVKGWKYGEYQDSLGVLYVQPSTQSRLPPRRLPNAPSIVSFAPVIQI